MTFPISQVYPKTPFPTLLPNSSPRLLRLLLPIPSHTLLKWQCSPKAIQSAPNRKIDLAITQALDELKIGDATPPAGVSDGDGAPLSESAHEIGVNAALQSFVIGGVDEEFRGVWFEGFD